METDEATAIEDRAETLCNEIVGWLGDERIYAACMGYSARAEILAEVLKKVEEIYLEMPYDEGS